MPAVQEQQQQQQNKQPPQQSQPASTQVTQPAKPIIKSANFDLLSDIDFSASSIPVATPSLQPLTPTQALNNSNKKQDEDTKSTISLTSLQQTYTPTPEVSAIRNNQHSRNPSADNISICSSVSSIEQNFDWESASMANEDLASIISNAKVTDVGGSGPGSDIVAKYKDAFDDPKLLKWFHKEVERLERFIDTATVKTLNGTTPLDGKWKELQDRLVKDESKRTVNVAKLFPEKNRSIDSIPYDHARISLGTLTDDYINAGFVKVSKVIIISC